MRIKAGKPMDSRLRGNDGSCRNHDRVEGIIPAKAGIHRRSPTTCTGAPDTSSDGVLAVIPAKAGIHTASGEHECRRTP